MYGEGGGGDEGCQSILFINNNSGSEMKYQLPAR